MKGFKVRRTILGLALVGLLGLTAWGVRHFAERVRMDLVRPRYGPIVEAIYGLGTVTAANSFELKLNVATAIRALYVQEGDEVSAGAPLVKLEDLVLFRAPFSGRVTAVPFKAGENVFPQVPIIRIVDLKDLYVVVSLEQEGALRVRKEQKARLIFEDLRGKTFHGTVQSIYPDRGEFLVRIEVKDLPAEILPGMTADVAIEVATRENALLVPVAAVSGGKVLVNRNGQRERVAVDIGIVDGQWAEVTSQNLGPHDSIVIKNP